MSRALALGAALLAAAACAGRPRPAPAPIVPSEKPAPAAAVPESARIAVPEAPEGRRKAALFDSDLGPDAVDVSDYPARERRNYAVYSRVCSRCHTLARSINAPYATRGWWDFYILNMRMRSDRRGEALSGRDARAILDFLDYDSNRRKVSRAAEFEAIRQELKRRFDAALDERVRDLSVPAR